jgi:tubulin-specific chaperone A
LARSTALIRDQDFIQPTRERMVSTLDGLDRDLEALQEVLSGDDLQLLAQVKDRLEPLASKLVGRSGVAALQHQVLEAWRSYETTQKSASDRIVHIVDRAAAMAANMETAADRMASRTMGDIRGQLVIVGAAFLVLLVFGGGFSYLINRSISKPLTKGVAFAEAISQGDFSASLEMKQKDEIGDLARALDHMAGTLRRQDWLRAGKAGLDDRLRGEQEVRELAAKAVGFLVHYLNAQLGALYLAEESGELKLTASHAFTDRAGNFNAFKPGEGLVGQAGLERQTLLFSEVTRDAPAYNYGVAETTPRHFLAAPLVYRQDLVGVLLIGSVGEMPRAARDFLEENLEAVAIAIQAANSRSQVEELLDQTQQQAEALRDQQQELRRKNMELEEQTRALKESEAALQEQQEELRVTNEELEEQAKALKDSQARLQEQQEELKAANEELEERTKALEEQRNAIRSKNVQLKKAQKELKEQAAAVERASRYKSEFLANMSHELRTPLNSILILSRILAENQEGNLSDKQLEYADTVHTSGKDLLDLINEILDLAKVESGRMEISLSRVRTSELVQAMRRMFEPVAERTGLGFVTELAPDCPEVLVTDSKRLTQVLRNLLSNAFKFTEEGEAALRIGRPAPDAPLADSGLEREEAVAFQVADTGVGVPEDKQEVIFEAFKQADGTTSRKFGGTGLGLSISREFARLLGGELHMDSEVGRGSTFTLYLPEQLAEGKAEDAPEADLEEQMEPLQEEEPRTPPEESSVEREQAPDPDREGNLLLIVEDDPVFAEVLSDLARKRGFEVLLAQDGEHGLHLADYHRPDGVLLDVKLPGIDGFEVMERLKESPRTRHIPVHFISAANDSMQALRMGAVGYLRKPVEPEDLEAAFGRIEQAIEKPVKKLLVVEDDESQRKSILELVGGGDVAATAVATGQEALDLLSQEPYDCVILDLGLSDISGFDLLDAMAEREDLHTAPVIVYTGRELSREEEARLARHAKSIIVKGARSPERLLDEATLFLHQMQEKMPKPQQKMLRAIHDPEEVFRDKTVLIVDDDLRNVFALGSVLEAKGMTVAEADNGRTALNRLQQDGQVDIVLMDIMMPEMDGFEAMRRIREMDGYQDLPIIALTAKAMKGDKAKCIEAGANDYLSKPVDNDKLLSLMRVWLHR